MQATSEFPFLPDFDGFGAVLTFFLFLFKA